AIGSNYSWKRNKKKKQEAASHAATRKEATMSYLLPHLHSGWAVDQAILSEEERVVIIRFGHDWVHKFFVVLLIPCTIVDICHIQDPDCMKMDEILYGVAEKVSNMAVIYLVDISEVPDFNKVQYTELPCNS